MAHNATRTGWRLKHLPPAFEFSRRAHERPRDRKLEKFSAREKVPRRAIFFFALREIGTETVRNWKITILNERDTRSDKPSKRTSSSRKYVQNDSSEGLLRGRVNIDEKYRVREYVVSYSNDYLYSICG